MSHPESRDRKLAFDSYIAVALQPKVYGCRNREDIKKNLEKLFEAGIFVRPAE